MHVFASCMSVEPIGIIFPSPYMHTYMFLITMIVKEKVGRTCKRKNAFTSKYRSAGYYYFLIPTLRLCLKRKSLLHLVESLFLEVFKK